MVEQKAAATTPAAMPPPASSRMAPSATTQMTTAATAANSPRAVPSAALQLAHAILRRSAPEPTRHVHRTSRRPMDRTVATDSSARLANARVGTSSVRPSWEATRRAMIHMPATPTRARFLARAQNSERAFAMACSRISWTAPLAVGVDAVQT